MTFYVSQSPNHWCFWKEKYWLQQILRNSWIRIWRKKIGLPIEISKLGPKSDITIWLPGKNYLELQIQICAIEIDPLDVFGGNIKGPRVLRGTLGPHKEQSSFRTKKKKKLGFTIEISKLGPFDSQGKFMTLFFKLSGFKTLRCSDLFDTPDI